MDQKYVVIWNRALAQRKEWLVLGGARKDAVNRTGIFHTGAKKALVAFHLMGLEVVVASSDDRGDYFYNVDSKDTEIGQIVMGQYRTPEGAVEMVETTYTTAIADNAWLEPFNGNSYIRAFGQFLLNAVGTSPDEWNILYNQGEPEIVPGTTRVYVPQVPEVMALLDKLEEYFTWGQIPLALMPTLQKDGSTIVVEIHARPDSIPSNTVVYHTGLIAYCETPIGRQFRYAYNIMGDTKGVHLSEERHIRSISKVHDLIAKAYESAINASNTNAIGCLLDSVADGEGALSIWTRNPLVAEMFFDRHGRRVTVAKENMVALVADKVGRPVVGIAGGGMIYTLEKSGVDKATDTDNIKGGHIEEALGKRQRALVQADVDLLLRAGLASGDAIEYHQFTNVDPASTVVGTWNRNTHSIGIRSDMVGSRLNRLAVLVHEHRHVTTVSDDWSYKFSNKADRDLVRLLLALYNGRSFDEVADESD